MYRVLACVTDHHHVLLLLLVAAVGVTAFAATGVLHHHRATSPQAAQRLEWMAAQGAMAGGGAWAMHFIGMVAYDAGFPIAYSLLFTISSAFIGGLGVWAAFEVRDQLSGLRGSLVAGAVFAAAILGLHYVGIWGIGAVERTWALDLVTSSALACLGFSIWGMHLLERATTLRDRLISCGCLMAAVLSLHVIAMGALTLTPDPMAATSEGSLLGRDVAVLVALGLAAVLSSVAIMAFAETRIAAEKVAGAHQMRLLADAAREGLVMHDGASLLKVNASFGRLVGAPEEAMVGRKVGDLFTHEVAVAPGQGSDFAVARLATADGSKEVELFTRQLDERLFVTAVRDLSDQRRAESAEMQNQVKSRFLASMSHELRTPLTSIIAYAEIIEEMAVEDARQRDADDARTIIGASRHLLTLISEILDFAKLEAGRIALELVEFDARAMFAELEANVRPLVEKNRNRLRFLVASDIATCVSDPTRMKQCILNLASNAAKFTKDGIVSLDVRREAREGVGGFRVEVGDTGVGMSREVVARIFQPFTQADESVTRRFGGTGLGLAITKELVERLGGEIDVASTEGIGSTFTIWFPLDSRPHVQRAAAATKTMMEAA